MSSLSQLWSILPSPRSHATSSVKGLYSMAEPYQLACKLRNEPGFIWLDGSNGRHYFFTRPLVVLSHQGAETTVSGPGGVITLRGSAFDVLEAALKAWAGPSSAMLVGFLSYELSSEVEDIGSRASTEVNLPTLHMALYDSAFLFDENGWGILRTDAWREVAESLPADCEEDLVPLCGSQLSPGPLESTPGPVFEEAINRTVNRICAGDLFQANLCRRMEAPLTAEMIWPFYRRLRSISPSRYGAFLNLGWGRAVMSVSPELFLKVKAGTVESCPIKGTRRRGATNEEDQRLAADLLASEKDRAELAMIVDVMRNDLGRVCQTGSIHVNVHGDLMTLPTVHHTFSNITGQLRPETQMSDLLRATFPAASISGAPKIEAMRTILREEGQDRGPSMGAIGWISLGGDAELSVAIRTAVAFDGRVVYHAGCGITADSIPREELEESRVKASAFVSALGLPERAGK